MKRRFVFCQSLFCLTGLVHATSVTTPNIGTVFPAYSAVSEVASGIVANDVQTGAIEPDGTLISGTDTLYISEVDVVEQLAAAAPEPSALLLIVTGISALVFIERKVI